MLESNQGLVLASTVGALINGLGIGRSTLLPVSPLLQNHFLVELSTENQRATPEATKRFEDDAENSGNNITDFVTCSSSNRR